MQYIAHSFAAAIKQDMCPCQANIIGSGINFSKKGEQPWLMNPQFLTAVMKRIVADFEQFGSTGF